MKRIHLLKSIVLACPLLLTIGCSTPVEDQPVASAPKSSAMPAGAGRNVSIVVQDYRFVPSEIAAKPGEKLHLVLSDMGQNEHNIDFDLPGGSVQMPSDVMPGKTMEYDIVVPKEAGKYYFHCPVGNHYSRGMVGDLLVQ